jgi:hypothetical protein
MKGNCYYCNKTINDYLDKDDYGCELLCDECAEEITDSLGCYIN